jgi:hypothetical protein
MPRRAENPRSALIPAVITLGILLVTATGCGSRGPARYDISGTITFRGKPVPAGSIMFIPTGAAAGEQPVGFCTFREGEFESKVGRSPGTGSYRAVITGCDGVAYETRLGDIIEEHPLGKNIFVGHVVELDLPARHGSEFEIVVPDAER